MILGQFKNGRKLDGDKVDVKEIYTLRINQSHFP